MSTATAIDAQQVKTLREKTGAGLMDCKKALAETNGDLEAAIDFLRTKTKDLVIKKGDRDVKEGVISQFIAPGAKVGVLVEINCETDFVAKNDIFKAFCDEIAKKVATEPGADLEADRASAVQKLGENIRVRRSSRVEVQGHGAVAAYIHTGGKVGVLVEVGAEKDETTTTEAFRQLVRDITLQIAAASPVSVDRTGVPADLLERERAIYMEQVPAGKPANVVENIIKGKIEKYFSTVCLVDQAFVKNPDQTIAQLVAAQSKELGDKLVIRNFLRFKVGEEITA